MDMAFDGRKADKALKERGLDFAKVVEIFRGFTSPSSTPGSTMARAWEKRGQSHFPHRRQSVSATTRLWKMTLTPFFLNGRLVVLVWTPRGTRRRIISMRKANAREETLYKKYLDES